MIGGILSTLQNLRGGFCPPFHKLQGVLCPPCKNMRGVLSTYAKMSRGCFVRGVFCPTFKKEVFQYFKCIWHVKLDCSDTCVKQPASFKKGYIDSLSQ